MTNEQRLMPIQTKQGVSNGLVPEAVYMAAYEVYCELYRPQPAMVTGGCRGGFGIGELTAFLYARAFPRNEWAKRANEAFEGMRLSV